MVEAENLTNRELLFKAMPLTSLSREQWNALIKHLQDIGKTDPVLIKALQIIEINQARLEVIQNYFDYYSDVLDEPVHEGNFELRT